MVRVFHRPESRPFPQALHYPSQERGPSEPIPRALNEQLGNSDVEKMFRAFDRRLFRRVQRKPQENQAANVRQRFECLRLGSHATAERFAAREQRKSRRQFCRPQDGGTHGRVGNGRSIRPLRTCFHVGKLESEGAYAGLRQQTGHCRHERMRHAGPGSVREHQQRGGVGRFLIQRRNGRTPLYRQAKPSRLHGTLGPHSSTRQLTEASSMRVLLSTRPCLDISSSAVVVEPAPGKTGRPWGTLASVFDR